MSITKSYIFSHTSTKTHFFPFLVSEHEKYGPYWYRTITWSQCFDTTIASTSWWFQLDSQHNFYYKIVHFFSHINQNAFFSILFWQCERYGPHYSRSVPNSNHTGALKSLYLTRLSHRYIPTRLRTFAQDARSPAPLTAPPGVCVYLSWHCVTAP